jgi:hypothetical protein
MAYGALGPRINPPVEVSAALRVDLMGLAILGAVAMGARWAGLVPLVVGGLLGAAFVGPWAAVPWLVLPAGGLGWAWRGRAERRPGLRPISCPAAALVVLAVAGNAALLGALSSRGLRIPSAVLEARDFRANSLLADVPVHDAWAIELTGRSSPTLDDLVRVFRKQTPFQATPAIMGLGMLRGVVGMAFGWEDPRWSDVASSFLSRVTDEDRRHSSSKPGDVIGIWRVLYALPREGAVETLNGTAHVAVIAGLGEERDRVTLFLSFRVREVNWTTRFYMGLIDPARRFFVYPSLLRQFAHTWRREGRGLPENHRIGRVSAVETTLTKEKDDER